jgi:hypothetical protein
MGGRTRTSRCSALIAVAVLVVVLGLPSASFHFNPPNGTECAGCPTRTEFGVDSLDHVHGLRGLSADGNTLDLLSSRSSSSTANVMVTTALLGPSTVLVPQGSAVDFALNLSTSPCPAYQAPPSVVLGLTFDFGDGFQYPETVSVSPSNCTGLPGEVSVPVEYIYHEVGSFVARANVDPFDGSNLTSNPVTVNITAASPTSTVVEGWSIVGFGVVFGTLLAATLLIRRYSRKPPSLSPYRV